MKHSLVAVNAGLHMLLVGALVFSGPVRADEVTPPASAVDALVLEALEARPELERVLAEVRAARERVPQARALPDPMLQVGVQNDGFTSWEVGKMEQSWVSFMVSETFPFPGKTALRGEVIEREVRQRLIAADRVRLSVTAEVRRAYLSLQLARERLELLGRLTALWEKSAGVAQIRYETADGSQADVLRARLELERLRQRRRLFVLEERLQVQALNRLRQKPLGQPIETPHRLSELDFPTPPEEAAALTDARQRSPELLAARAGVERAAAVTDLAGRLALPDLSVGAGVMVRGPLAPMWTVTVGVPLPVFSGPKQVHGVEEAKALAEASGHDAESVEQLLQLRTRQRLEAWSALLEVWGSYQHGLLAQAEATAVSTLGQYRAGKVSFASVLEANAGSIAEADAALQVLADGWRLRIAQAEVSLAEVGAAPASMGSASQMPGAGSTGFGSSGSSSSSTPGSPGDSSSSGM